MLIAGFMLQVQPMKNAVFSSALSVFAIAVASPAAFAQAPKQVLLSLGSTASKTVKGKLVGGQLVDYLVNIRAGQTLALTFAASNSSAGYLVYAASTETAMATSDISGNKATCMMPIDGPARVRLFVNRAAGRRGESTTYTLMVKVTGKPLPALKGGSDALIPGTPYHATADVPFEHYLYKDIKMCKAGVIRRGVDGTATLEFLFKGLRRRVLFVKGQVVATDAPVPATTTVSGDTITLRVGVDETYRFNKALLYGG